MRVILPWPDKKLSPNARLHWGAKVGPKQDAKRIAAHLTIAAQGFPQVRHYLRCSDDPIAVTITFYPPDKRHRDDDNMIGAFKSWRDGIADALGVNDRRFRPQYCFGDAAKPGRVEVAFPEFIPSFAGEQEKNASADSCDSLQQKNGPSGALTPPSRDLLANEERTDGL
jgi:crossover junction endodeoxyribonuclease RusA